MDSAAELNLELIESNKEEITRANSRALARVKRSRENFLIDFDDKKNQLNLHFLV